MKLRILYSSNAFWCKSGYGIQGHALLPRLRDLPCVEEIRPFAWFGLQGGAMMVNGFKCYPGADDPYGNDIIGAHARDMRANVVITLADIWVLRRTAQEVAPAKWCPWFPVDHDPIPDAVLTSLSGAYRPIVYAKWAQEKLREKGIETAYIPHGVEPEIMRVLPDEERKAAREKAGIPDDAFLAVMVAANKGYPDRKAFQVQMRAFAQFQKEYPDALLYLHTDPTLSHGGLDLMRLAEAVGLAESVRFPPRYELAKGMDSEYMATMFNSGDVLLNASMAEGFGIPIIEAQACGLPVIVTDFSSMPELVRWGKVVKPLDKMWTLLNSWQAWPSAQGVYEALKWTYWQKSRPDLAEYRRKVSAKIHAEYGWDVLVEHHWQPFLESLAIDLDNEAAIVAQIAAQEAQQPAEPEPITTDSVQIGDLAAIGDEHLGEIQTGWIETVTPAAPQFAGDDGSDPLPVVTGEFAGDDGQG